MRTRDVISSLAIGELAALLMLAISANLSLPPAAGRYLLFLPLVFPIATLAAMAAGAAIGRVVPLVYQFTKFALVGGLNFLVDLGVLNLLIAASAVSQGAEAVLFKGVAFVIANIWSYGWNRFWTFDRSGGAKGAEFAKFFVVSLGGLAVNVAAFALFNSAIGPRVGIPPKTWANLSAAGAAVAGLVWNFAGYKLLVFRGRP